MPPADKPIPLRPVDGEAPPRIIQLQKALEAEAALLEQRLVDDLAALHGRLSETADYPIRPLVREVFRNLAAGVQTSLDRLNEVRG